MKMQTNELIELINTLIEKTINFDITVEAESLDIDEIARFCGEKIIEFWLYEDKTAHSSRKLIRIRD